MPREKSTDPKFYEGTLKLQKPQEGKAGAISVVVVADSYKEAWGKLRKLTQKGSDHFKSDWADSRGEFDNDAPAQQYIEPGDYTAKGVKSLTVRKKKDDVLSVERLLEVAAEKNVKISAPIRALIDELKAKGPLADGGEEPEFEGTETDGSAGSESSEGMQAHQ